jgi:hypothetical protein
VTIRRLVLVGVLLLLVGRSTPAFALGAAALAGYLIGTEQKKRNHES